MKRQLCNAPDRHEPRIVCGYPLPCPHHTVVVVIACGKSASTKKKKRSKK